MVSRKKMPIEIEKEVLIKSRRRCCICYGLDRDETIKKGQIAHLDQDPSNNDLDNLAFMCFNHHDEYDGETSQSKKFTLKEVKQYRDELYEKFKLWEEETSPKHLLNFLAYYIDANDMLDAALEAAGEVTWQTEGVVAEALSCPVIEYTDGDLWMPILYVLNYFQSWGWLSFKYEEIKKNEYETSVRMTIKHQPICGKLVELLKQNQLEKEKRKKEAGA